MLYDYFKFKVNDFLLNTLGAMFTENKLTHYNGAL